MRLRLYTRLRPSKPIPSLDVLAAILTEKFASHYSCEQFGLYGEKAIFISKSDLVSVQISKINNEIELRPTSKPAIFSFISLFAGIFILMGPLWEFSFLSDRQKLVSEIGSFLNQRYG